MRRGLDARARKYSTRAPPAKRSCPAQFVKIAQCATMFATTSLADTRQSFNCQRSRLVLRSTGRCLQSPHESTSVRPQRRCPTRLLGEAIRTHHAATPRSSLVAGPGAYTVSPLCSDVPLSEWHSSVLPRREDESGSGVEDGLKSIQ